jgi:deoxyribonuclease-1
MRLSFLFLLSVLTALPAHAAPLVTRPTAVGPRDFKHAKQVLPRLYANLEQDFYCGCNYKGKTIDQKSCGFRPRKNAARAARLEWEHVVPAWNIGHQRQCWQQGGRKHCAASDPVYGKAEGDLVNLVPAIGEVNGDRSNFRFNVWDNNPTPMYGQCRTVVDFKQRRVQPRQVVRGRIARIQMYMHTTYRLRMSDQERRLFCTWAKAYPVDAWEREREQRIWKIQGSGNPFVSQPAATERFCGTDL